MTFWDQVKEYVCHQQNGQRMILHAKVKFKFISKCSVNYKCNLQFVYYILGKQCPKLLAPSGGSVLLPCIEEFGITCLLKCSKGFHMEGFPKSQCVVKNSNETEWTKTNLTCSGILFDINLLFHSIVDET